MSSEEPEEPIIETPTELVVKQLSSLRPAMQIAELGQEGTALAHVIGIDCIKRANIHFIEPNVICYVSGNAVVFLNTTELSRTYLLGIDQCGIGCVAVHPSKKYFAVGGVGCQPKIYVYSYPEMKVVKVMNGGAEKGYTIMSFNRTGKKLASVASSPDYMLTIWDWEDEKMGLHAKAFGQDVYSLQFSYDDEYKLTTSGTGHIKFWKISATFTGMKLQGAIGKFGKVDLSDIEAFIELPDGKVVSGTETGQLLLWEGNFIKCRFILSDGSPCHRGVVTYLNYDRQEKCIISAGDDGYVRWWDFQTIDSAEVDSDHSMDYVLYPIAEYNLGDGHGIKTLIDSGTDEENKLRSFLYINNYGQVNMTTFKLISKLNDAEVNFLSVVVQSLARKGAITIEEAANNPTTEAPSPEKGVIEGGSNEEQLSTALSAFNDLQEDGSDRVVAVDPPKNVHLVTGHVSAISGLDSCPCGDYIATCDAEGHVFVWNYLTQRLIARRHFLNSRPTFIAWLPLSVTSLGASFAVGFHDGIVRVLSITQELMAGDSPAKDESTYGKYTLTVMMTTRPHNSAITSIVFSNYLQSRTDAATGDTVEISRSLVVTAGQDGNIFLLDCTTFDTSSRWYPIRFIPLLPGVTANVAKVYCRYLSWSRDSRLLLCSCTDDVIREVDMSPLIDLSFDPMIPSYEYDNPLILEQSIKIPEVIPNPAVANLKDKEKEKDSAVNGGISGSNLEKSSPTNPASLASVPSSNAFEPPKLIRRNSMNRNNSVLESSSGGGGGGAVKDTITIYHPTQPNIAMYSTERKQLKGIVVDAVYNSSSYHHLYETSLLMPENGNVNPVEELAIGLYSYGKETSKDHCKAPVVQTMRYSWSDKMLVQGTSDGSVLIRPTTVLETYLRCHCHSTDFHHATSSSGTVNVAVSHDDRYVISVGSDGVIVVQAIRLDLLLTEGPRKLQLDIEAKIFEGNHKLPPESFQEPSYMAVVTMRHLESATALLSQFPISYISIVTPGMGRTADDTFTDPRIPFSQRYLPEPANMTAASYSIQDSKLKSGEDAKMMSIEDMKNSIRRVVKELRAKFDFLRRQNDSLPEDVRLPKEKLLQVDGEYWELLDNEKYDKLEQVHRENAYHMEKSLVLKKKLKERFMNGIIVEEMKLSAFPKYSMSVSSGEAVLDVSNAHGELQFVLSLRTQALDANTMKLLKELRNEKINESWRSATSQVQPGPASSRHADSIPSTERASPDPSRPSTHHANGGDQQLQQQLLSTVGELDPNALHTASVTSGTHAAPTATANLTKNQTTAKLRRELRQKRLENLRLHEQQRPKENEDDMRDIEAMQFAERTLGNYKLKFSDDYEISEEKRVNAPKKIVQMAILEEKMLKIRLKFNEKYLSLRKWKYQLIFEISRCNLRIREINSDLSEVKFSVNVWEPQIDPSEYPDDREEVTDDELRQYMASRLGETIAATAWEKITPPANSVVTGGKTAIEKEPLTGNFIGTAKEVPPVSPESLREVSFVIHPTAATAQTVSSQQTDKPRKAFYEVDDSVLKGYYPAAAVHTNTALYGSEVKKLSNLEKVVPTLRFIRNSKSRVTQSTTAPATTAAVASDSPLPEDISITLAQERRKKLLYERDTLLTNISTKIDNFNQAVQTLIVERHDIIRQLKLAEYKLFVLFKEYQLLLTFEDRDTALQNKHQKSLSENNDIKKNITEVQQKLDSKTDELNQWQAKLQTLLTVELKNILPESNTPGGNGAPSGGGAPNGGGAVVPYVETLMKIFKKKIKRAKMRQVDPNNLGGEENGNDDGNNGDYDDEEDYSDDDEDLDDDDDFEEVDDICPPGCEPALYQKIIDLREKRCIIDENVSDLQKSIEETKKLYDRYKQKEKQIIRDVQQVEMEVKSFHLQKQAALNQIGVIIPMQLSQIYGFDGSGVVTVPSDTTTHKLHEEMETENPLFDANKRMIVEEVDIKSHVLFNRDCLSRLDERIQELHVESAESQQHFQELHRERIKLKKERELHSDEIKMLENKCVNLQMLKFGRVIELDELEAGADKTKERDIEAQIKLMEDEMQLEQNKRLREIEELQRELDQVTLRNTEYLRRVAEFTEEKMRLTRDLNNTGALKADDILPVSDAADLIEKRRMTAYIQQQAQDIDRLRTEITILKRKDIPPALLLSKSSPNLPLPPIDDRIDSLNDNIVLPPIHRSSEYNRK